MQDERIKLVPYLNFFCFGVQSHTNWYNGYILLLKNIVIIFLSLRINSGTFFFFFYHVWHLYVRKAHLNFPLYSCLPTSALCTSFPRRMTRLAMEVLKWSSLWRDLLPRVGGLDKGGCTCQSIPTKSKTKKSKRFYKWLWAREKCIRVCAFYIKFYLITKSSFFSLKV